MAKNHEKAAKVDVEGGEVNERACMMNDKSRPSKDPEDTTGDGKRHPDEPTEPPDQPKGASARGGEERVKGRVPTASKGRMGATVRPGSDSGAPDMSDDSPRALTPPNEPAQRRSKSPSVELEGERREASSCDIERTSAETDASEASGSVEDAGEQLKKPQSASEHEHKHSKRKEEQNSPSRPREEPDEARGEAVASGGVQSHLERTRTMENERVVETNALRRDTRSGRHAVELEASRVAEGDWDRANVAKGADHDGICPRSDGNERVVERRRGLLEAPD